ncbi:glycosyltransferase family 4 protein [Microbacterium ureisolvens]|uniref:glycosyltransferase family 4 protein n=1 Tax=Microbacterium ureisolvens TaxID=2781186 RepID=UPI003631840C
MVCPYELITGGSQINAIDLAARMRARGHEVRIFGPDGPLTARIHASQIPFTASGRRPDEVSAGSVMAMAGAIRRFRPHVVHTYEAPAAVNAALAAACHPYRAIATVLSMSVPPYLPADMPLTVGTHQIARSVVRAGAVHVIEPPIDTTYDAPGDVSAARESIGVDAEEFVVAVVGRLSDELDKARGVIAAIEALDGMALSRPVTLIVAGTGDMADAVRTCAEASINPHLTVRLEGDVSDPRAIYDAADVVFGMGGSALRALAHAKPLVVQGVEGFWVPFTPQTAPLFYEQGFYGEQESPTDFSDVVRPLMESAALRAELGAFGRRVVTSRYDLDVAADELERLYLDHVAPGLPTRVGQAARAGARYAKFRAARSAPGLRRAYRSILGRRG